MKKYGATRQESVGDFGRAYKKSLLSVMNHLGVELAELKDLNCCGATASVSMDGTKIRHPLEVLTQDVGLDAIRAKVVNPLHGWRVAPYYGCREVRPYSPFDHARNPTPMDRLLTALGAEVMDYPLKTKCCGANLKSTVPETRLRLPYLLLKEAVQRRADMISTMCPLCQFNLEAYQNQIDDCWWGGAIRIAVVYFTQLMGLAFGMPPNEVGLKRELVPLQKAQEVSLW